MLKLGIEQTHYERFGDLSQQLKKIKEHGWDCVDYQGFVVTDGNPMFESMSEEAFSKYVRAQKAVYDQYAIQVSQTHAPWRWPPKEDSREEQEKRLWQMQRAVKGTALLGCDKFVVHALMPDSTQNVGKEKETLAVNTWFFNALCQTGKEWGVTICIENMPMPLFSLATVRQLLDFCEMLGQKNLKICLDTGHLTMFKHSAADAVRMIGKELLAALHVHDNDGKADQHKRPYEGVIGWKEFALALKEIGFEGVFSLECGILPVPDELAEGEFLALKKRAAYLAKLASK